MLLTVYRKTRIDKTMANMTPLQREVADVMLISLRARLHAARGYILNTSLQLECNLLCAQISALESHPEQKVREMCVCNDKDGIHHPNCPAGRE